MMKKCGQKCEVFSRVVGYYRPVRGWNVGKKEEFEDRKVFVEEDCKKNKKYKDEVKSCTS